MVSVQAVDWLAIAPVALVVAALLAVIVVHALRPALTWLTSAITLGGLVLAGGSLLPLAVSGRVRATFCSAGGCSFEVGGAGLGLQAIVLVAALVTVLTVMDKTPMDKTPMDKTPVGASEVVQAPLEGRDPLRHSEFWVLVLAATAGTLAVVGARDLFTLLVAVETATLPTIGLVGAARTGEAAVAAIRLLLVSVLSFAITLVGIGLLFTGTGTVHLTTLADVGPAPTVALGAAFIVAGLGYKVAALPFGLWVADVYPAAPVMVTLLLSTVSKIAGVGAVLIVVVSLAPGLTSAWLPIVVAVTMTLGNVVALTRRTAIGLLAWSTVAQAGWALLPLAGGGTSSMGAPAAAASAVVTYLLAYSAASMCVLVVVLLVSRHHPAGRRHAIADQAGLARTEPLAGAILVLALLSLAGLPPGIAGLVAKVAALQPVVASELWWLAVLAAVNVVIGLAYYLRWVWLVVAPASTPAPTWRVRPGEGAALALSAGVLVVFTVLPGVMV